MRFQPLKVNRSQTCQIHLDSHTSFVAILGNGLVGPPALGNNMLGSPKVPQLSNGAAVGMLSSSLLEAVGDVKG